MGKSLSAEYHTDGLRLLAHYVIVEAVDDYTGMWWSRKSKRFKRKHVRPHRKASAQRFLHGDKSSLVLCCEILGADPDVVRAGAESRLKNDLPKRQDKNKAV